MSIVYPAALRGSTKVRVFADFAAGLLMQMREHVDQILPGLVVGKVACGAFADSGFAAAKARLLCLHGRCKCRSVDSAPCVCTTEISHGQGRSEDPPGQDLQGFVRQIASEGPATRRRRPPRRSTPRPSG